MSEQPTFDFGVNVEQPTIKFEPDSASVESPSTLGLQSNFFEAIDQYRQQTTENKRYSSGASNTPRQNDLDVFNTWKRDPSKHNSGILLTQLQPHIESAVRAHTRSTSPVLLGQAKVMVMRSLKRYDGRSSLPTFINSQLAPLKRQAAIQHVGVKMSRSIPQDKRRLQQVYDALEDELGRSPSYAEIADRSGISIRRIEELEKINLPVLAEREFSNSDGEVVTAGDHGLADQGQLWEKAVYHDLDPKNQFIMQHTTGLYGAKILSNQEIARRLKISPAAVSQRKNIIGRMLEQP